MDVSPTHADDSLEPTTRRSVTTEDFSLKAQFDNLAARCAELPSIRLDLPVAHWAVGSDRRLPYGLLDRTVRQISTASYESLLATPGVGRKKFASLLMLLQRALESSEVPTGGAANPPIESIEFQQDAFAPESVSQVIWAEWQETVQRHRLESEPLGRLAPSLQMLPTVIWSKPLGDYLRFTIDELRSLKTHGDKRVTAVLQVFHLVHSLLGNSNRSSRVLAQLTPAFVPPVEQWIYGVLSNEHLPSPQDLRQNLLLPLLNQIERDAGETVHRLAAGRLGVEAFPEGVRDQSLELGVTRARIYQLLETCGDVMQVRWPAGRWMFKLLIQRVQMHSSQPELIEMLESLQWLLYPTRRAHAAAEAAIA
ncbi:MAG: hypothetical protein H6822_03970 [Planctomycetaceae bacterium]|nr:hypothetical protein [Planctomycetales bacterium]MCB9921314.1 hypothetical protein [Planctomycetaceae bacterium]